MQIDRHQLAAIAGLARTGSFEKAAAQLLVTRSAISQRIKAIEDLIGATVVVRGKPCVLTAVGQRLLRHHDEIELLENRIVQDLAGTDEMPILRIGLSEGALSSIFMPVFAAHAGLLFDFAIGSEQQCAAWLDDAEITVAVTTVPTQKSGYEFSCIGVLRYLPVVSPAFAAMHLAADLSPSSLRHLIALKSGPEDALPELWMKRRFAGSFEEPLLAPAHCIPECQSLMAAATAGMGWGLVPEPMALPGLAKGQLVLMDPLPLDQTLYWHCRKPMRSALQQLEDRLMQQAASILRVTTK